MKFNTPLPQSLPKECSKAAKIFASFVDSANNGLDGIIPRSVLQQAKGFAIFTVVKAGFVFSARAGSGVVIARLDDGSWSAPSAIGIGGMGVGGQVGAEVTDFLVVLNSRSAVQSFMASGSLQLGGSMSVAIGPLGRNGEASGSLNTSGKIAAMYSYSKTKGLFGGVSIEGSVIMERQEANALAYSSDATVKKLLSGAIPPPEWASPLIQTLESLTGVPGVKNWVHDQPEATPYVFGSGSSTPQQSPKTERIPSFLKTRKFSGSFSPSARTPEKSRGSYFDTFNDTRFDQSTSTFRNRFDSEYGENFSPPKNPFVSTKPPSAKAASELVDFESTTRVASPLARVNSAVLAHDYGHSPTSSIASASFSSSRLSNGNYIAPKAGLATPLRPGEVGRAIALYDFNAVESGDLSFRKGQVISIRQKSNNSDDWWRGVVDGREGIFPANFVEVV